MSNGAASRNTTSNKRVRFETDQDIPVSSPMNTPPVKIAMESVQMFAETLHPSIAPVLKDIGERNVSFYKNLHRKNTSLKKLMDDDESIPRSVNVLQQFKLNASKSTEERAEFATYQEETAKIIGNFRTELKKQVTNTLQLEVQDLRKKYQHSFIAAIKQIAEAEFLSIIDKNKKNWIPLQSEYFIWIRPFEFINIDLGHEVFCEKYKAMHGLAIFPYPAGDKEDANKLLHNSQELKRIIQGIMVDPVSAYLTREKELSIHIALEKFRKEINLDEKCAETQALMDIDPPQDAGLVKSLIADATKKETKKLRADLGQIKKLLSAMEVKDSRGQQSSASKKKEKARIAKEKKLKKKKAAKEAEEKEKGTSNGNGKKKGNRRKKKNSKK